VGAARWLSARVGVPTGGGFFFFRRLAKKKSLPYAGGLNFFFFFFLWFAKFRELFWLRNRCFFCGFILYLYYNIRVCFFFFFVRCRFTLEVPPPVGLSWTLGFFQRNSEINSRPFVRSPMASCTQFASPKKGFRRRSP